MRKRSKRGGKKEREKDRKEEVRRKEKDQKEKVRRKEKDQKKKAENKRGSSFLWFFMHTFLAKNSESFRIKGASVFREEERR